MLRVLAHEGAAELERVLAGRPRRLVHEALHVDAVLVRVDAAPGPDRHVRVAHHVFDQEVRHAVAELRVARLLVEALELALVLAAGDLPGAEPGVDRLAGDADVQADEVAGRVEPGGEPALRDRAVEVVGLVLLARPDELIGTPGNSFAIATVWCM